MHFTWYHAGSLIFVHRFLILAKSAVFVWLRRISWSLLFSSNTFTLIAFNLDFILIVSFVFSWWPWLNKKAFFRLKLLIMILLSFLLYFFLIFSLFQLFYLVVLNLAALIQNILKVDFRTGEYFVDSFNLQFNVIILFGQK